MVKTLLCSLIVLSAIVWQQVTCALQAQGAHDPYSCQRLNNSESVWLDLILPLRIPTIKGLSLPAACMNSADQMVAGWRSEDEANYITLDNRLCAYRSGWVEKVPGTCKAGGPPPICPENHWIYVGKETSWDKAPEQEKNTLQRRRGELIQASCSCKLSALQREDITPATSAGRGLVSTRNRYAMQNNDGLQMSCTYGCPPGTTCKNGTCHAATKQERNISELSENPVAESPRSVATEKVRNAAAKAIGDQAAKKASTQAIGVALKAALEMSETFAFQAGMMAYEVAKPTMLGTERDLYDHVSARTATHLQEYYTLAKELDSFHAHGPSRDPKNIVAEMRSVAGKLREDMQNTNLAYQSVVDGHEIRSEECPNVVAWQVSQLNQSIANILTSLPQ